MTFLEKCVSCSLQRQGFSKEDAKVLLQYLYPASTLEIVQSKMKYQGRFHNKKIIK